ncbi:MAG: AAA family ATPase [Gammaproteobacteria bacterium]|nr:AAA family ATPase [Gammaproteobacteria bacterium]
MKLERLDIQRLPGISEGFVVEGLKDGINLITGPNATGKSSLLRALRYLLQKPQREDPDALSLAAEFSSGEAHFKVTRTGRQITWTRNGEPSLRPALPGPEQIERYRLSMEHLLKADDADEGLATELLLSLRGGFDIARVRIPLSARFAHSEGRQLQQATRELRRIESESTELNLKQKRLPAIEQEIRTARAAEGRAKQIRRAKQLLQAVRDREQLMTRLQVFPSNMEKMKGTEIDRLTDLNERQAKVEEERRQHEQEHRRAKTHLEEIGLASFEPEAADIDIATVEDKLRHINELRGKLDSERERLLQLQSNVSNVEIQLGGLGAPKLDIGSLTQADEFAEPLLKMRATKRELETKIRLAGKPPDENLMKDLDKSIEALRDWLSVVGQDTGARLIKLVLTLLIVSLAATIGAAVITYFIDANWSLIGSAGAGICMIWAIWKIYRTSLSGTVSGTVSGRRDAELRFTDTGLDAPSWERVDVRSRLKELEGELGALVAQRNSAAGSEQLKMELEEQETGLVELETKKTRLAETIGFDPTLPVSAIDRFIRLTRDWDKERGNLVDAEGKVKNFKEEINETVKQVVAILSRWQPARWQPDFSQAFTGDMDRLEPEFNALKRRLISAKDELGIVDTEKRMIASLKDQFRQNAEDMEKVYKDAGLAPGQLDALEDCLERRKDWLDIRQQLQEAKINEELIRSELKEEDELLALVDAGEEDSLDDQLGISEERAGKLEARIDERSSVNAQIEQMETQHPLEDAIGAVAEARAVLVKQREAALTHKATEFLLDDVEKTFRSEHQPLVLNNAQDLFSEVTAHAFKLVLSENGEFTAIDTKQNAPRSLEELSTGTRMQLLLAVRMAWMRGQEQTGETLPVFLDEALTTSDEERFAVMANSLDTLTKNDGIQVIYLSARQHEQDLWRHAIGKRPHLIDLAKVRSIPPTLSPVIDIPPRQPIPAPGKSAEEYARVLGVPGIDPYREASEIHLFHLLRDDLTLLHSFMEIWRVDAIGPFATLLDQNTSSVLFEDPGKKAILKLRCRATEAWIQAWRQGRGRKIGRIELEQSGAFSNTFIDKGAELAASSSVAGNAQNFLQALRDKGIRGFHKSRIENLESWFEDNGYTDKRPTLTADERRNQVLLVTDIQNDIELKDISTLITWLESALPSED